MLVLVQFLNIEIFNVTIMDVLRSIFYRVPDTEY